MYCFCIASNLIEGIGDTDPQSVYIKQHRAAFDYIRADISLKKVHKILMDGLIDVEGERAGEYRQCYVTVGNDVPVAPGPLLESLMMDLVVDIPTGDEWELHNRFEKIHPFADGNGRLGRLLLNAVRMRHSPDEIIIVDPAHKQEYYQMIDGASL